MSTKISWPDESWTYVWGCTKVSEGCRYCFAERIDMMTGINPPWTIQNADKVIRVIPESMNRPLHWKEPRKIFVNSMSDFFHPAIPTAITEQAKEIMRRAPQHTYIILTKRPERATHITAWPDNLWLGVSVESKKHLNRLDILRTIPAALRFVSFEPLLEDLAEIDLTGIGWVIVGGESGVNHRPMDHAWVRNILKHCRAAGIPFFFKQSSAWHSETGTLLEMENGDKIQIREYPAEKQQPSQMRLF